MLKAFGVRSVEADFGNGIADETLSVIYEGRTTQHLLELRQDLNRRKSEVQDEVERCRNATEDDINRITENLLEERFRDQALSKIERLHGELRDLSTYLVDAQSTIVETLHLPLFKDQQDKVEDYFSNEEYDTSLVLLRIQVQCLDMDLIMTITEADLAYHGEALYNWAQHICNMARGPFSKDQESQVILTL